MRASELVSMAYVQRDTIDVHDDLLLQPGNSGWIGVTEDGDHWSDSAQLVDHLGSAHVAGVQDEFHAAKRGVHGGAHQSVSVRDKADGPFGSPLAHSCIMQTMSWTRLVQQLALRSLRKPSLIPALFTVAWRFRRRGWYRRPPFLPLPARDYLRWRMYTAYGDADAVPPVRDVERYAFWTAGRS